MGDGKERKPYNNNLRVAKIESSLNVLRLSFGMHQTIKANLPRKSRTVSLETEMKRSLTLDSARRAFEAVYREKFEGDEKVLEVGSGRGYLRRIVPKDFKGEWVQLDLESILLQESKERFPSGTYALGSAYALPFAEEQFDVVIGLNSYNILDNLDLAIKEAARVLKPNGLFMHILCLPERIKPGTENLTGDYVAYEDFHENFTRSASALYFNQKTINKGAVVKIIVKRRTEEQRKGDGCQDAPIPYADLDPFIFANIVGRLYIYNMTIANWDKLSDVYGGLPQIPKRLVYAEHVYRTVKRISPQLARLIEPPCIELTALRYTTARK